MYKEVSAKLNKLQYITVKLDKPEGQDYQYIKYKLKYTKR